MLLAAGLGTRLRPVTDVYAKPAVPFLNIPLLYYAIAVMEAAGAKELVANTHYKPEQIENLVRNMPGFKGTVHLSPELEKPLGSGGGVWAARKWLDKSGDFIVANADEIIFPSTNNIPKEFIASHKRENSLATIYVMPHPKVGTQFGGVWTDPQGFVHGFGRQKPESKTSLTGYHYVGKIVLAERIFQYLPEGESNLLYDALMAGIVQGEKVRVFRDDACTWYESGNPNDFLEATGEILRMPSSSSAKKSLLELGHRFWHGADFSKLNDTAPVLRGANAQGSADIRGFAVIGDNCVIGRNCVIEESVLMPGAKLPDGTNVRRQIIL